MSEGGVVTSPVNMWLQALDLLLERISASENGTSLLARVCAISGAGQVSARLKSFHNRALTAGPSPQQHASVYWTANASRVLSSLDPTQPLAGQFDGAFSSPVSPNWQDSSTTAECREMENLVGGEVEMAKRTGSRAHERFTGPQILKLRRKSPDIYANTDRIRCIS